MAKSLISLELLLSFQFPSNDCFLLVSRSTFPYFLFLLHFFQLPVLPNCFVPHFPSQIPLENGRSRSLLQHTSFHISLPFSPIYLLFFAHFLIPYFPSQNPFKEVPPPAYFLPFPLLFPRVHFRTVDFTLTFLYCVCNIIGGSSLTSGDKV